MEKIIEFIDFSVQYHSQSEPTLKNINLIINKGEKVVVVGSSGSGKSTLGNCINGLLPHAYKAKMSGELKIKHHLSQNSSIFKRSKVIGTLLQDSDAQFVGLSVAEDIAFSLENDAFGQPEMKRIVEEVATIVDVNHLLENEPHELSGGQKQRVAMGGVLVDQVEVLLFDEPLANLDPKTGKSTIALIDQLCKKEEKTIIIIEHRIEDVFYKHVDRVIIMDEGRIVGNVSMKEALLTNVLKEHGLREPLYISALKYSGISLNQVNNIEDVETIDLSTCKDELHAWFDAHPTSKKEKNQQVVLELKNIDFRYDKKKILDNISFKVHAGEMIALVGKNGAGKSTISKVILGFEKQEQGSIYIDGTEASNDTIKERALSVGVVLQSPNQMISKTMIYEEIALGLVYQGLSKEEIDQRVEHVLQICGLYPFRNWPISALSYGQKKRVCVASILVLQPKILILDEPTAGQDYKHYHEIMEFLKELNEQGQTIILITHDMHLMLEYGERAIVLADGKIIKDDEVTKVLSDINIVEQANLKETSLGILAKHSGIEANEFMDTFIHYEREHGYER